MLADLLLVLHVLGAVIWVGGMFFALMVLRPSLAVVAPPQRLALHRQVFRRFFLIIWHVMPIQLATGFALVFLVFGGFQGAEWNVHLMTVLGLIMAGIFVGLYFGPWAGLRRDDDLARVDRIRRLIEVNLVLGLIVVIAAAAYR
jgi:uncharacterized membrane protein